MPVTTLLHDAHHAVVTAQGEFDFSNVDEIRAALLDQLEAGRCALVLDIGQVSFVDAAFLGALVHVRERALRAGGSLVVAGANGMTRRMFRLTGLDELLPAAKVVA